MGVTCESGIAHSSPPVFSGVHVARSLAFGVMFCLFVPFFLAIALYVPFRLTVFDYHFGIFKLFPSLNMTIIIF